MTQRVKQVRNHVTRKVKDKILKKLKKNKDEEEQLAQEEAYERAMRGI